MRSRILAIAVLVVTTSAGQAEVVTAESAPLPDPEIMLGYAAPWQTPQEACAGYDYLARIQGCTRLLEAGFLSPEATADALQARATARMVENDTDGAGRDLAQAVLLAPGNVAARVARASLLLRQGHIAAALADLDFVLARETGGARLWSLRGHAHLAAGMIAEATADFAQALRREPNLADAHYGVGLTHLRGEAPELSKAMAAFARAVAIDPRHAEAYYQRGLLHMRAREWKRAQTDFDYAIMSRENYAAAHFQRGRLLHMTKRFRQAIDDYTTVVTLDSRFAPALDNRGRAWAMLGDAARAAADFGAALRLSPDDDDVRLLLEQMVAGNGSDVHADAHR